MPANRNRDIGIVELFNVPEMQELLDRQPHLAATVRQLIDSPPKCPACDGAVVVPPLIWVRVLLPAGPALWSAACDACVYSGTDLLGAIAVRLREDGIVADLRILDPAHLHSHGGRP